MAFYDRLAREQSGQPSRFFLVFFVRFSDFGLVSSFSRLMNAPRLLAFTRLA